MSTSFPSFHEFPNPGTDGVARIDKDAEAEFEVAMDYADKNLNIHSIAKNALKTDENYVQVFWGDRKAYFKEADYQQIQNFHKIFQEFVSEPNEVYEAPARPDNLEPLIITPSYHAGIPTFERTSSMGESLPPVPETPVENEIKNREPTKEDREDLEFLTTKKQELAQLIKDFPDVTNLVTDWESIKDNLRPLEEAMNKAHTYSDQADAPKELRSVAQEIIKSFDEFQMAFFRKISAEMGAILVSKNISPESKEPIEAFTNNIDSMITQAFSESHTEAEWEVLQTAKDRLDDVKALLGETAPKVAPLKIPENLNVDTGNIATYYPSDLPTPPSSPIPPPPPLTPSTPPPPPPPPTS